VSGSTPVVSAHENVILPVLPLRDQCLFPEASLTHVADRPAAFACLEIAARCGRRLLAVAQRDPSLETPTARDLQAVGTIAYVADNEPTPKGDRRVELDGLRRARIVTVVGLDTLFAELQPLDEGDPGDEWGPAVEALARYLHSHAELRSFLEEQRRSKEPMSWVNLACQHLPITATARQKLLESDAPERCLKISRGLDALLRKEQKEHVS
jgi:ATP-dependent Lon protease